MQEIHVSNDVNLSSIENTNQNDELLQLNEDKKVKKVKLDNKTGEKQEKIKDDILFDDEEDIIYKSKLIRRIGTYKKYFSKFLTEIKIEHLEKKSAEQLEALLTNIKDIVSNRNDETIVNSVVSGIPDGIEKIGINAGFDLQGYSHVVNSNPEYHYCMMELIIESNMIDNLRVDPKLKLFGILAGSNKITRPMSIGLLSVAIMFVLNGFSLSMMGALKGFALGSVSNIVGQWGAQILFPQRSNLLVQASQITPPSISVPIAPSYSPAPVVFNDPIFPPGLNPFLGMQAFAF